MRLSCLAQSSNGKYLAAAEGENNDDGQSLIYLIDLGEKKLKRTLVFHQKGIQSIAFGFQDKLLISSGVQESNCLVLHSVEYGNVLQPKNLSAESTNKIIVKEDNGDSNVLEWVTVGSKGSLTFWLIQFDANCNVDLEIKNDFPNTKVRNSDIEMPTEELMYSNFLTAAFRDDKLLIGCSDGTICAFDSKTGAFCENGKKAPLKKPAKEVTQIVVRQNQVVVATSSGCLYNYSIPAGTKFEQSVLPPEDQEKTVQTEMKEGSIVAISMDDKNEEGMIGTSQGKIFYICLKENKERKQQKLQVQLVCKVSPSLEDIDLVRFDPSNQKVFMANCGPDRGEIKLLSAMTLDTVCSFKDFNLGPVRFITSNRGKKTEPRMIGYASGVLRFVMIDKLLDKEYLRIELQHRIPENDSGEFIKEELTCGCFSSSGNNWAVGTSFGAIILGAQQKDLFKEPKGWVTTRIDGLMRNQDYGITSLSMTAFNPNGMILASFENGEVKLWTSHIPEDRLKKLQQRKDEERGRKKTKGGSARQQNQLDLHEIGISKFDIADLFDMFEDPHDFKKSVIIDDEDRLMNQLYAVSNYKH